MDNFDKNKKAGKACADCGRAMIFENLGTVVCGMWHATFTINSLCDEFKTPDEVKEINRKAGEALRKSKPHLF